jgi:Fe-S-cluster containining protein
LIDIRSRITTAVDVDSSALCGRCDAICCRLTVVLTVDDHVPTELIATQRSGPDQLRKSDDGWCAALDRRSMRCGIYDQRPQTCRRFFMSGPYCLSERLNWSDRQIAGTLPLPGKWATISHTLLPAA